MAIMEPIDAHSRRRAIGRISGNFSGDRCREERLELEVTQAELAECSGVSLRALRMFERGGHRARPATIESLVGALHRFQRSELARMRGAA